MSYYNYDEKDIASTLKKAMAQGAGYNEVKMLSDARKRKIQTSGGEFAKYNNDYLTQQADAYLASKNPMNYKTNVDHLYSAREKQAADSLRLANKKSKSEYKRGINEVASQYDAARKSLESAYKRNSLINEEQLASNGLGRGGAKNPSSGYGESSRVGMLANYQTNMMNMYANQAADNYKLLENYQTQLDNNKKEYNSEISSIYKDKTDDTISQIDKDRNYALNSSKADRDYNLKNQEFDNSVENEQYDRQVEASQTEYEKALNAFGKTGVVSDENQARILGVPVGTKTVEREEYESTKDLNERKFKSDEEQKQYERTHPKVTSTRSKSSSSSSSSSKSTEFNNAFKLFESIGYVIDENMAAILGIPVGTEYWKYTGSGIGAAETKPSNSTFKGGIDDGQTNSRGGRR